MISMSIVNRCGGGMMNRENATLQLDADPPCSYRNAAFESLAKAERPWNFALSANSIQGTQSAVAAGLGVSVVPNSAGVVYRPWAYVPQKVW